MWTAATTPVCCARGTSLLEIQHGSHRVGHPFLPNKKKDTNKNKKQTSFEHQQKVAASRFFWFINPLFFLGPVFVAKEIPTKAAGCLSGAPKVLRRGSGRLSVKRWWNLFTPPKFNTGVSINNGTPQIIHFNWVFHYQ